MRSRGDTGGTALLNLGIGGNRVLRDGLGPSVVSRLDRDVLAASGVRWLVVFAGANDIGTADATEPAQRQVVGELCTAYEQVAAKAHAAAVAAYAATLTPFGGNDPYDDLAGHREVARQVVNAWIRASRQLDAVLDFDQAVRDPLSQRRLGRAPHRPGGTRRGPVGAGRGAGRRHADAAAAGGRRGRLSKIAVPRTNGLYLPWLTRANSLDVCLFAACLRRSTGCPWIPWIGLWVELTRAGSVARDL